jgi:hypothetical protein
MKFFVWRFLYLLTATREAMAIPPWGISSRKAVTTRTETTRTETTRTETTEMTEMTTGTIPEAAIDIIAGDNKLAKCGTGTQDGIRGSEITNIWRTEIGKICRTEVGDNLDSGIIRGFNRNGIVAGIIAARFLGGKITAVGWKSRGERQFGSQLQSGRNRFGSKTIRLTGRHGDQWSWHS